MGSYVTSSRVPMFPKKYTYSYQTESTTKSAPIRVDVPGDQAYGLTIAQDTVYSYRTKQDDANDELRHMLDNREFNPLSQHDTGHEFNSTKTYVKNAPLYKKQNFSCRVPYAGGAYNVYYAGPIGLFSPLNLPTSNVFYAPLRKARDVIPASGDLVSFGTKAIAASSPTRSAASLAVALLELRDGLPKIPGLNLAKTRAVRNVHNSVGDEYLNVVFGWVPTLGDITKILSAMVNASKILNQYSRDSDSYVRRKQFFPEQKTTQLFQDPSGIQWFKFVPSVPASANISPGTFSLDGSTGVMPTDGKGSASLLYQETTKTWFSGAFRYHLDSGEDLFSRINHTGQMASKLLGARLDPATLWQAMPWSWLLDWFVDIGDIITNGTSASFNGQVLQYGYLMRTTTRTATVTSDAPMAVKSLSGDIRKVGNLTATFVSQRKERIRATPFGFGLNPNSFTAQQWAVLGALGMTRAPRSLY